MEPNLQEPRTNELRDVYMQAYNFRRLPFKGDW
jgi:hypothetical protein